MTELIVILGVLVILTLWIVGHNIYLWRTDVLSGSYISSSDSEPAPAGEDTEAASKAAAADWKGIRIGASRSRRAPLRQARLIQEIALRPPRHPPRPIRRQSKNPPVTSCRRSCASPKPRRCRPARPPRARAAARRHRAEALLAPRKPPHATLWLRRFAQAIQRARAIRPQTGPSRDDAGSPRPPFGQNRKMRSPDARYALSPPGSGPKWRTPHQWADDLACTGLGLLAGHDHRRRIAG